MLYFILFLLLTYILIIFKRLKKYKYNQTKDYIYNFKNHISQNVLIQNNRLQIQTNNKDTLILELKLKISITSYFFKPYIEIDNIKHYFEYGSSGKRYINISYINQGLIKENNCSFSKKELKLYTFKNTITQDSQSLIVAPHADDAELSSFGLYSWLKDVNIVTITAGENGVCNYCDIYKDLSQATLKKGKLRAFDAITTPLLGGVKLQNSLALGYFGGQLINMRKKPMQEFTSHIKDITSLKEFRHIAHSKFKLAKDVTCSYTNLKEDLKILLLEIKPKYIITPHPTIDSHPDHKESTYLIIELLLELELNSTLLLYTNHLTTSELYPHGAIGSSIDLPPNFKDLLFDSIYSFQLNQNLQKDKFFAIESMHDLRDSLIQLSLKRAWKLTIKLLKSKIISKDKSYFRRAVRANELFFVAQKRDTLELLLSQRKV